MDVLFFRQRRRPKFVRYTDRIIFGPHMLCFTHLNAPDLWTESGGDTDRIWRADGPNRVQRPTHEVGQPDTDRIQGGHGPNPDSVHKVLFFQ